MENVNEDYIVNDIVNQIVQTIIEHERKQHLDTLPLNNQIVRINPNNLEFKKSLETIIKNNLK